jgi:hypothetical protein
VRRHGATIVTANRSDFEPLVRTLRVAVLYGLSSLPGVRCPQQLKLLQSLRPELNAEKLTADRNSLQIMRDADLTVDDLIG